MTVFSKFISIVFHPIFVPLYAFICFVNIDHYTILNLQNISTSQFSLFLGLLVFFTIIFPLVSIYIMLKSKIVTDVEIFKRKERIPVLISSFLYLLLYYYFIRSLEFNKFEAIFFGAFLSVISGALIVSALAILITMFWKISLHTLAVSGLTGALIGLTMLLTPIANMVELRMIISISIFAVGLVGFSRLYLKSHSYLQVIGGMLLGFSTEFYFVKNGLFF